MRGSAQERGEQKLDGSFHRPSTTRAGVMSAVAFAAFSTAFSKLSPRPTHETLIESSGETRPTFAKTWLSSA